MKKIFTFFTACSLFAFAAKAQITITADDITPVGVTALRALDTLPDASIQPGGTGMQTWDFSALHAHDTISFGFEDASNTPYANLFPQANLAALEDTIGYAYFTLNNQSLRIIGFYGTLSFETFSFEAAATIAPPQSVIRFPANYNDTYSETVKRTIQIPGSLVGDSTIIDSVRLISTIDRSVNIDAYGSMNTPIGTYDVIRSTETGISNDSVFIQLGGVWQFADVLDPVTSINYNWWTNQNGLAFPVVNYSYSPGNGEAEVTWLLEFTSDAKEEQPSFSVTLQPNPATDRVDIQLPNAFEGTIEVYDVRGWLCAEKAMQGSSEMMDVKNLPSGAYVVVLKNKRGGIAGFEKMQIAR